MDERIDANGGLSAHLSDDCRGSARDRAPESSRASPATLDSRPKKKTNRFRLRLVNLVQRRIETVVPSDRHLAPADTTSHPADAGAAETVVMIDRSESIVKAIESFNPVGSASWRKLSDHDQLEVSAVDVIVESVAASSSGFDGRARLMVKRPRTLVTGLKAFETRVHSVFVRGHINGSGPIVDSFEIDHVSEMDRLFGSAET